ncbi:hypothetical protein Pve01_49840 [Planomonospora venezuelensis]|nr:hypothetical protein Pve01_49840 [Planomonospora venezuelensis]
MDPSKLEVGDIVRARVQRSVCLHLASAVDASAGRVQIGNNRGRMNGWTGHDRVFGICVSTDGVAGLGVEGKQRAA